MKKTIFLLIMLASFNMVEAQDTTLIISGIHYNLQQFPISKDYPYIKTFRGDSITLTVSNTFNEGILIKEGALHKIMDSEIVETLTGGMEYYCEAIDVEESEALEECENSPAADQLIIDHYIVSDYRMFLSFGEQGLIERNVSLLNDISLIYEVEFRIPIQFNITGHLIYTTQESDPYYDDPSIDAMLTRSVDLYNSTGADNTTVWTNKVFEGSSTIGLAYVNTLCSSRFSKNICINFGTSLQHIVLYAHEIGHNVGFSHDASTINIMYPSIQVTNSFSENSEQRFEELLAQSRYGCATFCETLPVTLEYFKANSDIIKWKTTSEVGASHFTLEGSYDGRTFEQLIDIRALNKPSEYSTPNKYKHKYFRVSSYDLSGEYKISEMMYVYRANQSIMNPLPDIINNTNGDLIEVRDMSGRLVKSSRSNINAVNLAKGMYTIGNKVFVKL